jgi:hypothetical protein
MPQFALLTSRRPESEKISPDLIVAEGANIFERIIRDPTALHRPMRETLCTEMLCCLLLNAPVLRKQLLSWFAHETQVPADALLDLNWEIDTEQAIGRKRDDLRISGYLRSDQHDLLRVLWTVEVKVAASFHSSTPDWDQSDDCSITQPHGDGDASSTTEVVNQLFNYDAWLAKQSTEYCAGIVVTISPVELPVGLRSTWINLTWSSISDRMKQSLSAHETPPEERLLVTHVFDFIRKYLADPNKMELTFDDVALLRAFDQYGLESKQKVARLVTSCLERLRQLPLSLEWAFQDHTFLLSRRCCQWAYLTPKKGICLFVGIWAAEVCVWIETQPSRAALKSKVRSQCRELLSALRERRTEWQVVEEKLDWYDAYYSIPMTCLLTANDQPTLFTDMVLNAVNDMLETGLISKLMELDT